MLSLAPDYLTLWNICFHFISHTHTHTYIYKERERERKRQTDMLEINTGMTQYEMLIG